MTSTLEAARARIDAAVERWNAEAERNNRLSESLDRVAGALLNAQKAGDRRGMAQFGPAVNDGRAALQGSNLLLADALVELRAAEAVEKACEARESIPAKVEASTASTARIADVYAEIRTALDHLAPQAAPWLARIEEAHHEANADFRALADAQGRTPRADQYPAAATSWGNAELFTTLRALMAYNAARR